MAGVEVHFFSRVIDAEADKEAGRVNGVVISGVEVREAGRDSPHIMPATLPSLFTGVDWSRVEFRPGSGMNWHDEYLFPSDRRRPLHSGGQNAAGKPNRPLAERVGTSCPHSGTDGDRHGCPERGLGCGEACEGDADG
jgi:hypothetical protein